MMETAGLLMLVAVPIVMLGTGLPAWVVLVGIALVSSLIGIAAGVLTPALLTAMPARLIGLLGDDLLQALPLYVLMGALLNHLPLARILFRAGSHALGRTPASPMLAGLGLGVMLAPMNGSVGSIVAMLSRTVQPRLDANGVPVERSAALVCAASTFGVVIPPSLVLILLGDALLRAHTEAVNVTKQAVRIINTQDVFLGALVPAAILFLTCLVLTWWLNRGGATATNRPRETSSRADRWIAVATVTLIVGLLAGVVLGRLYAVEVAATGGMALVVFGLATRTLTLPVLREILRDTMAITGALFALLVAATVFTLVLRGFDTDRLVSGWLTGLGGGQYTALFVVLGVLALCALVLDAFEIIFVVIPIIMPPLLMAVPDATWVAVLTLLVLQTSFLMPPFGYAVLMVRTALKRPLGNRKLMRALTPYVAAQLAVLALVLAFPGVVWHGDTLESTRVTGAQDFPVLEYLPLEDFSNP